MNKTIRAIYEGGVFRPLDDVDLDDKSEVLVTVEPSQSAIAQPVPTEDPLAAITFSSGIGDLAQQFDDYRFGRKQ